jgi:hypothetical protein
MPNVNACEEDVETVVAAVFCDVKMPGVTGFDVVPLENATNAECSDLDALGIRFTR